MDATNKNCTNRKFLLLRFFFIYSEMCGVVGFDRSFVRLNELYEYNNLICKMQTPKSFTKPNNRQRTLP